MGTTIGRVDTTYRKSTAQIRVVLDRLDRTLEADHIVNLPPGTLVGTWLYDDAFGRYHIIEQPEDGTLMFKENAASGDVHTGQLVKDGDWYVAHLRSDKDQHIGIIKLRTIENGIESKFKTPDEVGFPDTIIARQYGLVRVPHLEKVKQVNGHDEL